jgi:hypothetical protein
MTKNLNKCTTEKKNCFFFGSTTIFLSLKDVQVTKEAFSSRKRTSSTSKYEIFSFFSTFVGHFCPPGSGSDWDPDPQPCLLVSQALVLWSRQVPKETRGFRLTRPTVHIFYWLIPAMLHILDWNCSPPPPPPTHPNHRIISVMCVIPPENTPLHKVLYTQ